MIKAPTGPTKPEAGVIVASPATAPVTMPTTLGLPNFTLSMASQTSAAVAAEICVTVIAMPASPPAFKALPALKPNQPTQSMQAPAMVIQGACMLWVGWFGFNAGSALKAGGDADMAMTVTHISAATAALVWLAIESVKFGKPSVVGIVTGAVAGLATITPASGFVGPIGALVIGAAGGAICYA